MKLQLLMRFRDSLTDSFWFLPLIMTLLAGGSAVGSVALDQAIGGDWAQKIGWVWAGGPDGARGVLSTVAGSLMTVVSIVFSLTVTTLAQTSSHYGPRVLRNFTSDRFVQFTLGIFVSTFVYCLLVLRTVRSGDDSIFVPYISVNLGMLLTLASLAVLIFFIHHVSQSIQAETLISEVGEEFQKALPVLFPEHIGQPQDTSQSTLESTSDTVPKPEQWRMAGAVGSDTTGYLQSVDNEQLMQLATQHNLILKLEKRPGDFVADASPLVRVLPPLALNAPLECKLRNCFGIGHRHTPHQDALYIIQQLVEIAAHALSPGINEPFTALGCIDWLGAAIQSVAQRELPNPLRQDEKGQLRVIASSLTFADLVYAAFDPIRLYGADNPDIMLRLLQVIADIAPMLRREDDRKFLMEYAQLINTDAAQIRNDADRRRVADALGQTLHALTHSTL